MMTNNDDLRGSMIFNVSDEELTEPLDIAWDVTAEDDTIPTSEHRILKLPRSEEPHGHS
jgi:hypothetical protein